MLSRLRDQGDHSAEPLLDEHSRDLIRSHGRSEGLQQSAAEDVRQINMLPLTHSMAHARTLGIVHRDCKATNVLWVPAVCPR